MLNYDVITIPLDAAMTDRGFAIGRRSAFIVERGGPAKVRLGSTSAPRFAIVEGMRALFSCSQPIDEIYVTVDSPTPEGQIVLLATDDIDINFSGAAAPTAVTERILFAVTAYDDGGSALADPINASSAAGAFGVGGNGSRINRYFDDQATAPYNKPYELFGMLLGADPGVTANSWARMQIVTERRLAGLVGALGRSTTLPKGRRHRVRIGGLASLDFSDAGNSAGGGHGLFMNGPTAGAWRVSDAMPQMALLGFWAGTTRANWHAIVRSEVTRGTNDYRNFIDVDLQVLASELHRLEIEIELDDKGQLYVRWIIDGEVKHEHKVDGTINYDEMYQNSGGNTTGFINQGTWNAFVARAAGNSADYARLYTFMADGIVGSYAIE